MQKIGLVFSGGGGKGAYEIGVWKALKEFEVEEKIVAVSGTSVGALNGALFSAGDLTQAIKVWQEMTPSAILQIDIESILKAIASLHPTTRILTIAAQALGVLKSEGVFSQNGLEKIITDSLDKDALRGKKPFYVCCTDVSKNNFFQPLYKKLNDLAYEDVVKYLLGTSAIPGVFSTISVDNTRLWDGFLTDNTPIKPLIESEQCDTVITILLGRSESYLKNKKAYPNVKFFDIVPSGDTGEMIGSLNFKAENAHRLLEMGYRDTVSILEDIEAFSSKEREGFSKEIVTASEMKLIDNSLENYFQQYQHNAKELEEVAFESITALASNTGRIAYQNERGILSRIFSSVNGSNQALQSEINLNFANSLYATNKMIEKLHQRTEISLDISIALSNRVNYILHNQQALHEQNQEQYKMLENLKNGIVVLAQESKKAIDDNRRRIELLEKNQELFFWSHNLKANITNLNKPEQILKIITSYLSVAHNIEDKDDASRFLYATLVNIDFGKETVRVSQFLEHVNHHNSLELFEDMKSYQDSFPQLPNRDSNEERFDYELEADDFTLELYGTIKKRLDMKNALKKEKKTQKEKMQNILKILHQDEMYQFDNEIEELIQHIDDFKVIVPVIGKYSAGKSRLLNTYITEDKLFEIDTDPTTAIASEIHFGTENRVVLFKKDNTTKTISLESVKDIDTKEFIYLKYYLNYKKLQDKEDVVLVDMPGFESVNLDHNKAINHYFNRGSHYILVLSCESALDNSVLKYIDEVLSYGAKFSIIITKSDKKLPSDIEDIRATLNNVISDKYHNNSFFIGACSSRKKDIADFEKVIGMVYADASTIFKREFVKQIDEVISTVASAYKKLLSMPKDTVALEKKIAHDNKEFEEEVSKIEDKFNEILYGGLDDVVDNFTRKAEDILTANKPKLLKSAKTNTLDVSIQNLLRIPLNKMFKEFTNTILEKLADEALFISNKLNLTFSSVTIDTKLSWLERVINWFTNNLDKKIASELESRVIPQVVQDIEEAISCDVENISNQIKKVIEQKIEQKKEQLESLNAEAFKQLEIQQDELEKREQAYKISLHKLQQLKGD